MNRDDIKKNSLSSSGVPWVKLAGPTVTDTNSMKYSLDGLPWWGISGVSTPVVNIYLGSFLVPTLYLGSVKVDSVWLGSTFIQ